MYWSIILSFYDFFLFNRCIHFANKIFYFSPNMMFILFWENDSLEASCNNGSYTIKTWFIGTIHSPSFYGYSFSCSPYDSVHFSMYFIFIRPIMMVFCIYSIEIVTAVNVSCWCSIISCWNNSPILYYNSSCFSWYTLWCTWDFIGNFQKIFIVKHTVFLKNKRAYFTLWDIIFQSIISQKLSINFALSFL